MEREEVIRLSKNATRTSLIRYIEKYYTPKSQRLDLQNISYYTNKLLMLNEKSTSTEIQRRCYEWALLIIDKLANIDGILAILKGERKEAYQSIVMANIRIIWKHRCEERFFEIIEKIDDGMEFPITPALSNKEYQFPDFPL